MTPTVVVWAYQWRGVHQLHTIERLQPLYDSLSDVDWEQAMAWNDCALEDVYTRAVAMARDSPNPVFIGVSIDGHEVARWDVNVVNIAILEGVVNCVKWGVY